MIVEHSNQKIDSGRDPFGAVALCLSASQGCDSNGRSWSWAEDAARCAESYSAAFAAELRDCMGNGRRPDLAAAFSALEVWEMAAEDKTPSSLPSKGEVMGVLSGFSLRDLWEEEEDALYNSLCALFLRYATAPDGDLSAEMEKHVKSQFPKSDETDLSAISYCKLDFQAGWKAAKKMPA
jgi:hypothetical protein